MSIYSGFATRQQQQTYDQSISTILYILQKRLVKFYKQQQANEIKFTDVLLKIYNNLKNMEDSKYLQPKLTNSISQIVQLLKGKREQFMNASFKGQSPDAIKQTQKNNEKEKDKSRQIAQLGKDKKNKIEHKFSQQSKISLQDLKVKKQKIIITQRVAQTADRGHLSQFHHNNIIKKRVTSNIQHRSTIAHLAEGQQNLSSLAENKLQTSAKSDLSQKPGSIPLMTNYKKIAQGEIYELKKDRRFDKQRDKQKEKQYRNHNHMSVGTIKNEEKVDGREDVRELIKGYLVKKKKHIKDLDKSKAEIQQIFKP